VLGSSLGTDIILWVRAEFEKPPPRCSSLLGRSARIARRAEPTAPAMGDGRWVGSSYTAFAAPAMRDAGLPAHGNQGPFLEFLQFFEALSGFLESRSAGSAEVWPKYFLITL
jgi:hypothetical protein